MVTWKVKIMLRCCSTNVTEWAVPQPGSVVRKTLQIIGAGLWKSFYQCDVMSFPNTNLELSPPQRLKRFFGSI